MNDVFFLKQSGYAAHRPALISAGVLENYMTSLRRFTGTSKDVIFANV